MSILTEKVRREIKKELKNSGFDLKKMRLVADVKAYDGVWVLGMNCMEGGKMMRLSVPLKSEPSMSETRRQLKMIAPDAFLYDAPLSALEETE